MRNQNVYWISFPNGIFLLFDLRKWRKFPSIWKYLMRKKRKRNEYRSVLRLFMIFSHHNAKSLRKNSHRINDGMVFVWMYLPRQQHWKKEEKFILRKKKNKWKSIMNERRVNLYFLCCLLNVLDVTPFVLLTHSLLISKSIFFFFLSYSLPSRVGVKI